MWYTLDRFEEEWAVLQDDDARSRTVLRAALPEGVRAGDVLWEEAGRYRVDAEETALRREQIRRLEERLRGR